MTGGYVTLFDMNEGTTTGCMVDGLMTVKEANIIRSAMRSVYTGLHLRPRTLAGGVRFRLMRRHNLSVRKHESAQSLWELATLA